MNCMEEWERKNPPSVMLLEPEKALSLVRKYHPKLAAMMVKSAPYATLPSNISVDAINATTVDGASASDISEV